MRIFVVGNINAGKSYVASKLKKKYPSYKFLSIDEFRINYSDGSIDKEMHTRAIFAAEILKNKDAIIEFSGGETITTLFVDELRINSIVIIEVQEELDVCIERIKNKNFSIIPYPVYSEKLEETIKRLDNEFKNEIIKSNFKESILSHYKIHSSLDINELPLDQCDYTIKLTDYFLNKYDCLFAYGSLGRREIQKYSDVDLFIKTDKSIDEVFKDVKDVFPESEIIVQRNQLAIYINGILIELNIIKDLKEAQLYYVKSEIKRVIYINYIII